MEAHLHFSSTLLQQGLRMSRRAKWVCLLASAMAATAQQGGMGGPPREMVAACEAKAEGDSCTAQTPFGETRKGQCRKGPRGEPLLACVPSRPAAGMTKSEAIPGTQVSTAAVLCAYQINTANKQLGMTSTAQWSCTANERKLSGNGIPNHTVGPFPNAGNPNRISAQNVNFTTTVTPAQRQGQPVPIRVTGYAINGIKFDPGTAQSCTENCANHGYDASGQWRIEALNQTYFDFGVDENNAHVQPNGAFHYHGVPTALINAAGNNGQKMTLVGWAADGFPMYAQPAREPRSSYRLKTKPDAGRPMLTTAPMGTFQQDYEYVAGSGDLDECNGRSGVTPEFPNGTYYYLVTKTYPYVPRCLKGNQVSSQDPGPMPPPGPRR
jgi:hypothetical protein